MDNFNENDILRFHNNFTLYNEEEEEEFVSVGEYEVDIPYTYAPLYIDDTEIEATRSFFPSPNKPFNPPNKPNKPNNPPGPPMYQYPQPPNMFPPPPAANIPPQAPPPFIPSKTGLGVQKNFAIANVSPKSIIPCRFKFTYIWQRNGRSYWAFITNVDRYSISGWRFMFFRWVYFGLDLKRIDSFICY